VRLQHTLDLPARPTALDEVGDAGGIERQVGDEAVAVGDLATRVADLDVEPVDRDRLGIAAQRNVDHPAVAIGGPNAAAPDAVGAFGQGDAGLILRDRGVRGWLADEQEVAAGCLDSPANRLAGKQVVAEIDRPQLGERLAVSLQPAPGGAAFAVLLSFSKVGFSEMPQSSSMARSSAPVRTR